MYIYLISRPPGHTGKSVTRWFFCVNNESSNVLAQLFDEYCDSLRFVARLLKICYNIEDYNCITIWYIARNSGENLKEKNNGKNLNL